MNLLDVLDSGEYGRARALASQLPRESRTARAVDPRAAWGECEHLLALVADHLAFMRYEQAGGKGRKPKPLPRPSAGRKKAVKRLDVDAGRRIELLFAKRS